MRRTKQHPAVAPEYSSRRWARPRSNSNSTDGSASQQEPQLSQPHNDQESSEQEGPEGKREDEPDVKSKRRTYQPITTIDWRGEICQFLDLPFESTNKAIFDALGEASEKLQEVARLQSLELARQGPPRYQILHSVHCAASSRSNILYLSEPWVEDYGPHNAHLMGKRPIHNLELFLERNKDIKFLVSRDYSCCGRSPPVVDTFTENEDFKIRASALETGERITHLCPELHTALVIMAGEILLDTDHPDFSRQAYGSERIFYPYLWWYHSRGNIELFRTDLQGMHRDYLDLFRDYLKSRLKHDWDTVRKLTARRKMTREYLQYLFAPGQIIISHKKGHTPLDVEAYRTVGPLNMSATDGDFRAKLDVQYWVFDGTFEQREIRLQIHPLPSDTDEFDITDLSAYPIEFADPNTIEALRKRGRMFWKCRHRNYVQYTGAADDAMQVSTDARFMIDMSTYKQMHPENFKSGVVSEKYDRKLDPALMSQDNPDLGDDFFMCLPSTIRGFNMRTKQWEFLKVASISDVVWNIEAFDSLVIDPTAKTLVQAVVTNQIQSQDGADVIHGKGNGLFILLHGGPGTGKTLTAESVAEIAKKPLYRVTCGDIGTQPEHVEKYLDIVLLLGKTWDCVVLLDEADVFLEQRSLVNLERNALVSVFLRVLEYYDGILILTSNRVGIFDEAFKSRVQLNLRYLNLNARQRRQIWENFINRIWQLEKEKEGAGPGARSPTFGIDADDITSHLDELAEPNLNGREIRNAIATARQLARFYREPMQYKHLESVIGEARKFDNYLVEVRDGFTSDEIQRDKRER